MQRPDRLTDPPGARDDSAAGRRNSTIESGFQEIVGACRGRRVRRVAVGVVASFVLLGALGAMGPRTGEVSSTDGPLRAELTFPSVTRGGLPAPWTLSLDRDDRRPLGTVTVRTSRDLFALFDRNDLVPTPDRVDQDGRWTTWTYDDVLSSELVVEIDGRVQPGVLWRHPASTVVSVTDAEVQLDYATTVLP